MRVHLYTGSLALVRRSGVGQAVEHQRAMLQSAGVEVVTDWSKPADAVHINTVLPDAPPARRTGRVLRPFDRTGLPPFLCRVRPARAAV